MHNMGNSAPHPPLKGLKLSLTDLSFVHLQGLLGQKTQRQGEGKDEAQRWQHRQTQGQAQGKEEGGEGDQKDLTSRDK